MVDLAHLHLVGWDEAQGAIKIDLRPFRMAELYRANEDVRR